MGAEEKGNNNNDSISEGVCCGFTNSFNYWNKSIKKYFLCLYSWQRSVECELQSLINLPKLTGFGSRRVSTHLVVTCKALPTHLLPSQLDPAWVNTSHGISLAGPYRGENIYTPKAYSVDEA